MSLRVAPREPGTSQTGSPGGNGPKRRRWTRMTRADAFWGYAMIAPGLIGLLIFYIWPMLQTFYFSFTEWGPFGDAEWTGLANYRELFSGPEFLMALRNTLVYTVLSVAITEAIALVLAVLLNQKLRGMSVYRTLYFIPVVTMPVAIGLVWRWLYNSDYGVINYLLSLVGIEGANWLSDPDLALYAIVVVGVWSGIGYALVLFLGGLQTIPAEYYDAASVDGAGTLVKFFRITLPLLSPMVFFVTVISLINSLQVFDLIFVMISSGRGASTSPVIDQTQSLVYLFYKNTFVINEQGQGAAVVLTLFIIIVLITLVQFRLQRKWVHYE
jgi:multiple sugar transport system permease protein